MLLSKLLGERYREKPADAFMASHIFLLRGGYIRQVGNGIFSMLMPAKRIARKIEEIIRREMDAVDGQEVMFPVVLPAELWQESGRYESVGSELMRMTDRTGRGLVLGMTHEEAAVHLARGEARSYLKYPFMIYQIQTKFRDEPRARGGLIRVREFTMKDGYSFHTSQEDLDAYYDRVLEAYNNIFKGAGLKNVLAVASDTGMMGGSGAHEFMYISDEGEDSIVICQKCGYRANMEVADGVIRKNIGVEGKPERVHTPNIKEIAQLAAYLDCKAEDTLKATVYLREDNQKPLVVFLRGDLSVNEAKLKKVVRTNIFPLNDFAGTGMIPGFIGPVGLPAGTDIIFDESLKDCKCLIAGGNETDYHIKNVCAGRDYQPAAYHNITKVNPGDSCTVCGEPLVIRNGIEVGNIFKLGTKYSKSMGMSYIDQNGVQNTPIMGCYGIGVGRLLACAIEENHDENGPVWPLAIAPWHIHICLLNNTEPEIADLGSRLYSALSKKYEVIMDERDAAAGVKFADADLLGIPYRIVVSKRNTKNGEVELSTRDKSLVKTVKIEDLETELAKIIVL